MWQMGGPGYDKEAHRLLRVAEKRLAKSEYLAGDFYSIGDIGIWPHCGSVERFGASLDKYPNITRWFDLVGNARR